jgi:CBS domain-containing protein
MANATNQSALTVETASSPARRGSSPPPSPRTPQVADIMSRTVVTATADTPLPKLIDEMVRYGVSGIPIVDTESRLVGIVTEANLMSKPAHGGSHRQSLVIIGDLLRGHERRWESKARGLTAGQIMTTEVETAWPHEAVHAAARRMAKCGVKRLPVVDNDRLVGIVSLTDVLRSYT